MALVIGQLSHPAASFSMWGFPRVGFDYASNSGDRTEPRDTHSF
jgi:hypothetical protein